VAVDGRHHRLPYRPVTATWRLELDDWTNLSLVQRRRFALIVGDARGEWWGNGRAEFRARQDVVDCAQRLATELGLVAHYFYRIAP